MLEMGNEGKNRVPEHRLYPFPSPTRLVVTIRLGSAFLAPGSSSYTQVASSASPSHGALRSGPAFFKEQRRA